MIAEWLRGAADFVDAVNRALEERRSGFSEYEAADFLSTAADEVPDEFMDLDEFIATASDSELAAMADRRAPGAWASVPPCRRKLCVGWSESPDGPVDSLTPTCDLPAGHVGEHVSYEHPDRAIFRWPADDDDVTRLALKLHRIRELANNWRCSRSADFKYVAGELLTVLNEGIKFWTPPETEADDVVDVEVQGGRPADFDAVTAAYKAVMEWFDRPNNDAALIGCTPAMVAGIAVNAYRAALMSVGHEDLAAHIVATRWDGQHVGFGWADRIASDLLADYAITLRSK